MHIALHLAIFWMVFIIFFKLLLIILHSPSHQVFTSLCSNGRLIFKALMCRCWFSAWIICFY